MRDILFAVVCTYRLLLNGPRGGENFFINFTLSTSGAGLMVRTSLRPTVVMTLLRIVGVLILLTTVTKLISNNYLIGKKVAILCV